MTAQTSGPVTQAGPEPSPEQRPPPTAEGPAAAPSAEAFAEIVKQLPPGYALVPAGYELRAAPPLTARAPDGWSTTAVPAPSAGAGTGRASSSRPGGPAGPARPGGLRAALPPAAVIWGAALTVVGMMLLVFAADILVFGHVKHARDQQVALADLRADLANGTAPVNQTVEGGGFLELGRPLGLLDIPAIDLHEVYLEGTTGGVLQSGVGHRRDTVMPGQLGTSVLLGRRTGYGGPFSQLELLPVGAEVTITNGLGDRLPFRVVSIRRAGDPLPAAPASGSRVTFVTATGAPYQPDGTVRVDADLVAGQGASGQPVQATAAGPRPLTSAVLAKAERPMGGESGAWFRVVAGLFLLLPVTSGVAYARVRWGRWQSWLAGMPPLLALGVWTSDAVLRLLPNLM